MTVSSETWFWAIASGLVYYALAYWFYLIGLKKIPASLAALFLNLIPIFAVGGAYLFLAERLAVGQWIGAALILVAVAAMLRLQNSDTVGTPVEAGKNITGAEHEPAPVKSN